MARSTAPILLTGAISFGNQWLGNGQVDLKIVPATLLAAGALALVEQIPGAAPLAAGIGWIALITLLFTRLSGKPSPIDNVRKITGL